MHTVRGSGYTKKKTKRKMPLESGTEEDIGRFKL